MNRATMLVVGLATMALAACEAEGPEPVAEPSTEASAQAAAPPASIAPAATATPAPGPSAAPADEVPAKLQALGTEPFWSVEIDGTRLRYSHPEDSEGEAFTATRDRSAGGATWRGEVGGKLFQLKVARGTCSDGMSDTVYPFSAVITLGTERNEGCARPR